MGELEGEKICALHRKFPSEQGQSGGGQRRAGRRAGGGRGRMLPGRVPACGLCLAWRGWLPPACGHRARDREKIRLSSSQR